MFNFKIIKIRKISKNFNKIIVEPFKKNYTNTIGLILRRILLSSITGYSVTNIKINKVLHEFSYINGIKEDIIDLILNLKGLIFKLKNKKKVLLKLKKNKSGPILGSNIKLSKNVKLINPNHIIANSVNNTKLTIYIEVKKGKGYIKKTKNKKKNYINLDVNFSPVFSVSYKIKKSKINENLEKLIFNIKTNGAVSPIKAFKESILILIKQLTSLLNLNFYKKNKIKNLNIFFKYIKINKNIYLYKFNNLKKKYIFYINNIIGKYES